MASPALNNRGCQGGCGLVGGGVFFVANLRRRQQTPLESR